MASTKFCKICGKEYEYCRTNAPHQYRWQDVACSKEHAAQYFAKIAESRGQSLDSIPKEYTDLLNNRVSDANVISETDLVDNTSETIVEMDAEHAVSMNYTDDAAEFTASKKRHRRKEYSY
jgi:hypothetical protein